MRAGGLVFPLRGSRGLPLATCSQQPEPPASGVLRLPLCDKQLGEVPSWPRSTLRVSGVGPRCVLLTGHPAVRLLRGQGSVLLLYGSQWA